MLDPASAQPSWTFRLEKQALPAEFRETDLSDHEATKNSLT